MADEIIAATVIVLLEKAIAVAASKIGLMLGFYEDLKAMEGYAKDIQAVLLDAETKQSRNPIVLRWLKKVEGAAFEAEIVLDELLYESLRRQVYDSKRGAVKVCSFFSMSKHDISFRKRMGCRVRGINDKLKRFNLEVLDIGLMRVEDSLLCHDINVKVEAANRETDSLPEQFVVGRVKEEFEIVDMLLGSSVSNVHVSVLPIAGMGGLGKPTLAKSVYNNGRIKGRFSKRGWICVSDKFNVTDIFKGILESLRGGVKVEMSSRDAIVHGIQKEVSGERFLFVLDDVWNEDAKLWDKFFTSLVGLNSVSGSCCVLTTRLQTTANLVSTFFTPFVLDKLSDDDCWSILGRRATKGGEMPGELKVYRQQILKRCQGLPLAANAIGGLLSLQRKEDWLSIVENKVLKVSESVEVEITPILKLSYDYLPSPCIKKCFVYCSIYPKDTTLNGEELIELWMAEGFLREDMEGRTMEEVGADYLTILLQSSLLEKGIYGLYRMHDLVHDLAESISKREQSDGEYKYLQFRHVALGEEGLKLYWNAKTTLALTVTGDISDELLLKYRHVRVMHLFSREIKNLPNAIGKLKHVRCLNLSVGGIKSLPESLCKLYNLQILRLDRCDDLECLPQGLSNLISLRHLHFYFRNCELRMPPMMGRLTCLQTLRFFNVGEKDGRGIEELGSMRNLKGSIKIRNLEMVKGKEEARSANLFEKNNMIGLELYWGSTVRDNRDDENVLEGLEPCPTLSKLTIRKFLGVRFPGWLGKLSALVELKLDDCKNCTELGGAFPKLVSLSISGCFQLYSAPASFPVLETLTISGQVSVVRDVIGKTSNSLKFLSLNRVSGMSSLSEVIEHKHNSSLKELEICVCHDLIDVPSSTLECCTYLECFRVEECLNLLSCPLDLQQTSSLSKIVFSGCPKVFTTNAMPQGFNHLTDLKQLLIGPFSDDSIQLFDWSGLVLSCSNTLQILHLDGSLQKHSPVPEELQHFSSLVELKLYGFESIECLPNWFGNFTSLQEFELSHCLKLQHFTSTDAMERLKNLQILWIISCPLLRESPGHEISGLLNLEVIRH